MDKPSVNYATGGIVTGPINVELHRDLIIPVKQFEKLKKAAESYVKKL